jgi:hypothetical protein
MDSSRKIKVKNGVKLTFLTKTDYIGAIEQRLKLSSNLSQLFSGIVIPFVIIP